MKEQEIIPAFDLLIDGYRFLGRGPEMTGGSGGWHVDEKLFFRCIQCGTLMRSTMVGNWQCPCKSMGVDVDNGRFGSRFGDRNVLVYERIG